MPAAFITARALMLAALCQLQCRGYSSCIYCSPHSMKSSRQGMPAQASAL